MITLKTDGSIPDQPLVLPGFDNISRFWDRGRHMWGAKILPGEYYVTIHDELITTVLGSCVAACIRDKKLGIGGMNHFMLPAIGIDDLSVGSAAARYGNFAMEHLINNILRNGGKRENLEVKIFGGGRILKNMTDVGNKNIEFVRNYIKTEGLTLVAEDLGDIYPRKVVYFPTNGKVQLKKLRSLHNTTLVEREQHYLEDIVRRDVDGGVELF
jgi:chemotaxis protein CheD